ncbi:type IV secretion system protein [Fluoribacter dumoffii]|uniref:type IV secretion system protein n=1 Tax=Fluoribacter dumoffii TaxID=463 RepID=UPI002242FD63|nr:type IV secretion system protein [Fluoribacter dumoffii]MCW8452966.1 type IV secretion system protein [Fluoribacter dumoffii]MCW8483173.1 type IV secretion system protein [Fluoribacter dumoffii]
MSSMTYTNFIIQLAGEIDKLTRTFVFDGYKALSSILQAPLASMIVLYIVLKGYAIARGVIEQPQQELFRFSIRVGLIYMLAMNWEFFSSHARDLFVTGSETIATRLMLAVHKQGLGNSINQGLQNVLNEILKLGCDLFEAGSLRKLTPYFAGMMVFLSGSITLGLAFIEIVIAKLMLAVTLCTAPLFILFTLFDQTKPFFERWLGVLAGFSFVLIFVSSVVGLCVHLLHWVTSSFMNTSAPVTAAIWIPIFIVACLCVMGIMQAVNIGKSIGGSVCTSGGAAMVGGFIGSSLGAWGFSKTQLAKSRQGSSTALEKGKQLSSHGHNLFKQLHKNLRRGA